MGKGEDFLCLFSIKTTQLIIVVKVFCLIGQIQFPILKSQAYKDFNIHHCSNLYISKMVLITH